MTKYMTMREAFKCEDDDIPFVEGIYNTKCMLPKVRLLKDDLRYLTIDAALSGEWQVQKAEPKVLTVDELVYAGKKSFNDGEYSKLWWLADKADKNGQLREWLRPEQVELREAIKELLKTIPAPINSYAAIVHHKLKYLKPPI